jgi:methyltransferase
MIAAVALLLFVTLERLGELVIARRNTSVLMERGAVEIAPGHYPLIVSLHALWLAGLWFFGWDRPLALTWVAAFFVVQILRFWTLATLGRRWTTRIIIVPGEALVARGPYRFVPHPNYMVVIAEIAILPLCFGLAWFAALFSLANAGVLFIRISAENEALAKVRFIERA